MSVSSGQRPTAAARLAALPLVDSVCTKLSVVYIGAKCIHPGLWYVCDALESGVTAVLTPVMGKLEPHISVANDVACKSLDWLETAFPMLHTPPEQLVTAARSKVAEIQDAVSIAARGSADCVSMGMAWLTVRLEGVHQQQAGGPLVDRAIAAAAVGLEYTLAASEALVERMLPPAAEDKERTETLQGAEAPAPSSFLDRSFALATKVYRRSFLTSGSTLMWTVQTLPQYLQRQLVSAIFFLSQSRDSPTSKRQRPGKQSRPRAPEIFYMDSVQMPLQAAAPACRLRKAKPPTPETASPVKGCVGH